MACSKFLILLAIFEINNRGFRMIRDVYNNIALDDVSEQFVSYPKHVCVTREAALHCFVRDMSLSQLKILQIAIFEDPFFAHVDIKKNMPSPSKRSGFNLFRSKRSGGEVKRLMVYVEEKQGHDCFFVNYKDVLVPSEAPSIINSVQFA